MNNEMNANDLQTVGNPSGQPTLTHPRFISAHGVMKHYRIGQRRLDVLRGVDLEVERGEFVALQGASGAGKSTLLHLLGGLDVPDQGRITMGELVLTGMGAKDLARFRNRRIGFIFQAYHLMPDLTAMENVLIPARLARIPGGEAVQRAVALLEQVGLKDRMNHRPAELSGGEQQRVAIARCLVNEPELILADEPTGNLDSRTGQEILSLLLSLREKRNATLMIATHDPAVASCAGRCVVMLDGRVQG
jgi:ABC-type lipoprotein export system ATPase subunit